MKVIFAIINVLAAKIRWEKGCIDPRIIKAVMLSEANEKKYRNKLTSL